MNYINDNDNTDDYEKWWDELPEHMKAQLLGSVKCTIREAPPHLRPSHLNADYTLKSHKLTVIDGGDNNE